MSTSQQDLLKLQTGTESQNTGNKNSHSENPEQLLEREPVPDTGFTIVGNQEKGYAITLGKYRLTEWETKDKCYELIQSRSWDLVIRVVGIFIEHYADEQMTTLENLVHNILDDRLNKTV